MWGGEVGAEAGLGGAEARLLPEEGSCSGCLWLGPGIPDQGNFLFLSGQV